MVALILPPLSSSSSLLFVLFPHPSLSNSFSFLFLISSSSSFLFIASPFSFHLLPFPYSSLLSYSFFLSSLLSTLPPSPPPHTSYSRLPPLLVLPLHPSSRFKNKEFCEEFRALFEAAVEAERNKTNNEDEEDEQQDSETESNNGY